MTDLTVKYFNSGMTGAAADPGVWTLKDGSTTKSGGWAALDKGLSAQLQAHGMPVVGLPYSFQAQMTLDAVHGGSPYGATTITGGDGSRMPSDNELEGARWQGRYVAETAKKLTADGREASLRQIALAKAVEEDIAAKLGTGDTMALKLLLKRLISTSDPGMPDLWSPR